MKALKFLFILLTVLMFAGCREDEPEPEPEPEPILPNVPAFGYDHDIVLFFQDSLGNDLPGEITGGEGDLYTLDVVFEEGIPEPWEQGYMSGLLNNSLRVIFFSSGLDTTGDEVTVIPFPEKVTLKLTCPHFFGDNEVHDIVAWWKLGESEYGKTRPEFCYAEFNGRKFPSEEKRPEYAHLSYIVTIILDR